MQPGRLRPYLAAGVGLEEYGRPLDAPGLALVTEDRLAFAINAGGGLEVPVSRQWAMRSDARWYHGFGTRAHWRLFNGMAFRPVGR